MNVLKNEPKHSGHKLKNKLLTVVTSGDLEAGETFTFSLFYPNFLA